MRVTAACLALSAERSRGRACTRLLRAGELDPRTKQPYDMNGPDFVHRVRFSSSDFMQANEALAKAALAQSGRLNRVPLRWRKPPAPLCSMQRGPGLPMRGLLPALPARSCGGGLAQRLARNAPMLLRHVLV